MSDTRPAIARRVVIFGAEDWPTIYLAACLTRSAVDVRAVVLIRGIDDGLFLSPRRWLHAVVHNSLQNATRGFLGVPYGLGYHLRHLGNRTGHPTLADVLKTGVPVHKVDDALADSTRELLGEYRPDVMVICGPPILPEAFLSLPRECTLNIHTSILPWYRGGGSLFWPRFFDDTGKIGYTIHRAERRVDGGAILCQERVPVEPTDDSLSLNERCFRAALPTLIDRLLHDPLTPESFTPPAAKMPFSLHLPNAHFKWMSDGPMPLQRIKGAVRKVITAMRAPTHGLTGKAVVLFIHNVLPDDTPRDDWRRIVGHTTVSELRERLNAIRPWFRFIPLGELCRHLDAREPLPDNVAVLTVDDGYTDFADQLTPLLREQQIPGALFVATGGTRGEKLFHQDMYDLIDRVPGDRLKLPWMNTDIRFSTPRQRLLTVEFALLPYLIRIREAARQARIRELYDANGLDRDAPPVDGFCTVETLRRLAAEPMVELHPHGHSHAPFTTMSDEQLAADLATCRRLFEDELQLPAEVLAYPNGLYEPRHAPILREAGIRYAFTVDRDLIDPASPPDPLLLPRLSLDNKPVTDLLWTVDTAFRREVQRVQSR